MRVYFVGTNGEVLNSIVVDTILINIASTEHLGSKYVLHRSSV